MRSLPSLENAVNWVIEHPHRIFTVLAVCALIVGAMEKPI